MADTGQGDRIKVTGELPPRPGETAVRRIEYTVDPKGQVRDITYASAFADGTPRQGSVHIDCPDSSVDAAKSQVTTQTRKRGTIATDIDETLARALSAERTALKALGVSAPEPVTGEPPESCGPLSAEQLKQLRDAAGKQSR